MKFVIFNLSETGSIDFSQVLQTNVNSLKINTSQTQTFVSYDGSQPSSVSNLSTKSNEYTNAEFLSMATSSAWMLDSGTF